MTAFKPTAGQVAALIAFAKSNGRTWKSRLWTQWMTGSASDPLLQQIRNEAGPSWLARFTLPKGVSK